jgi:ketosteroid isomerase-like protein
MTGPNNRQIVDRYARAMSEGDLETQDELLHDDLVALFPQSGERIRGRANRRATMENYPVGRIQPIPERVIGGEDRWIATPAYTVVRVSGEGEEFVLVGKIRYPNGEVWHNIEFAVLRDGKIAQLTAYFAAPFEAPGWRAPYVERID